MADIQALLSALDVFSRAPDKESLERANSWLQDFQHSVIDFPVAKTATLSSDSMPTRLLS
jgi:transportin-3